MFESLRYFIMELSREGILPQSLQYGFVINALICALFIGPTLGGLGTMVVTKKMAFFSEAIGHAALTGVALGILLGEPTSTPFVSLFGYCILFAIFINYTRNRTKMSSDILIGVFLAISITIGGSLIVAISSKVNSHILESILFGSILTVNDIDIYILIFSTILLLIILIPYFNDMLISSFNSSLAAVRGVKIIFLEYLFILTITIITVASLKIVGSILVEALLIIPAASAKNLSKSMGEFIVYSIVFSTVSCILGIFLPIHYDWTIPSGGAIILVAAFIFIVSVIIKSVVKRFSEGI